MLYGYKNPGGKYQANTRISNTTYIGCRRKLSLADHVFIGHFNFLDSCKRISIDEGCQLTNYISIITHSSHIAIRLYGRKYINTSEHIGYEKGEVSIGAYCFIGPHSVIAAGTRIGKGSLVAAYSYVKGNFPDFAILSGNPAKVIGSTKNIDERFLRNHPELRDYYNEWASSDAEIK